MATGFYSSPAWRRLRLLVLERDGWLCQIRGPGCQVDATEGDHIVPIVDGGAKLDMSNVRASCKHCNASRGNRMLRERFEWAQRHMAGEPVSEAGPSREWW